MAPQCTNDDSIGPGVRGCRDDFDFTIKFERIFLSIIPASVFTTLSVARTFFLWRKKKVVNALWLQNVKLVMIAAYISLQTSFVILSIINDYVGLNVLAKAHWALSLIAGTCMLPLSFAEHARNTKPSILLTSYAALTILFDVAHARTTWLSPISFSSAVLPRIVTALVSLKTLILLVEAQEKSRWLKWDATEHSPEETSGVFNLGVFFWLNRLFLNGYRKVLAIDDLYPLDNGMATELMEKQLSVVVNDGKLARNKYALAVALFKAFPVPLLAPIAPRIALMGFTFCQPFFINRLLEYLEEPAASPNIGYGLIGASFLIYLGIAISTAFYQYYLQRTLYMIRGALAAAVYRKTAGMLVAVGGDTEAVTLMSTDVERILLGFAGLHEFWANPIEVALGCWLLQRHLGLAFLTPIVVIVICCGMTTYIGARIDRRQRTWMQQIQRRVGLTANVISNMKSLRISGITDSVSELIQGLRLEEIKAGNAFRLFTVAAALTAFTPSSLSPVFTFAVTSATLDVATAFTSLSYLRLVTNPLIGLFQSVPTVVAAFTCLGRIQEFLVSDDRIDFRRTCEGKPSNTHNEKREAKEDDDVFNTDESEPLHAFRVVDGYFGWSSDKFALANVNVSIPSKKLTMVVGPIASGKSTFCKALLAEVPFHSGLVIMSSAGPKIAYCEQSPVLTNVTLKENIIGYAPFDRSRYNEVIKATMLSVDLMQLPSGHDTCIGSGGIMLSGGQKQRVALARALYAETDVLVLDDVLSGLDKDTSSRVFHAVFGDVGLVRRRSATAILCTHAVEYLPLADHVIALGTDGTVVQEGAPPDIGERSMPELEIKAEGPTVVSKEYNPLKENPAVVPATYGQGETMISDNDARQMGDWKVYKHYVATLRPALVILFFVFTLLWAICTNAPSVWLSYWAKNSLHQSTGFYIGIYALFSVMQLAALVGAISTVLLGFVSLSGAQLHAKALSTVMTAPLQFFTTSSLGAVTTLFSNDLSIIDSELAYAVTNVCSASANVIGLAVVIAVASPYIAISYPLLFLVLYAVQKFYLRTSRQMRLLDLEAKSPLYSHFLDTIKGIVTMRAFGWNSNGIIQSNHFIDTSQRPAYLLAMIQQWLTLTLQMVVAFIAILLTALTTQLRASSGLTGASVVALMGFGETVIIIIRSYTKLETSIGAVARLTSFSEQVKPEDMPGEHMVPETAWPQHGAVEISGASASYSQNPQPIRTDSSGGTNLAHTPVLILKEITISIQAGEKFAICGRSGSGKSSLILLLLRLVETVPLTNQCISIDGTPLHHIDRGTLRKRIIAIPQDPVFLPNGCTVQANVDPSGMATEVELVAALEAVGLHQFMILRGGIRGEMAADDLSAGQKQLFNLGRAVLRRRVRARTLGNRVANGGGLLLLDEVSASVDQETERFMQEIIKVEFSGYTIIMVSHRLDMVVNFCDRVMILDQGSVVEVGQPHELLEHPHSRFSKLWTTGSLET